MAAFDDIKGLTSVINALNNEDLNGKIEVVQRIRKLIEENISYQTEFGEENVFTFLASNITGDIEIALVEGTLWAWIRLCRQEILNKSTMNPKNCELSQKHAEVLIQLLTKHYENEVVSHLISVLIMILCSDSEERQKILGTGGAPAAVVQVLKTHGSNPTVTEFACRAARNLSADDEVANILIQEGLGEELNLLLLHPDHPPHVVEAIVFVIINLSYEADIAKILGFYGCASSLVELIPRMMPYEEVINRILWALKNLSSLPNNIAILSATTICEHLIEISKIHRSDPDTIVSLVWILSNLSSTIVNVRKLLSLQIMSHLIELHDYGLNNYQEDINFGPIAEAIVFAIYNMTSTAQQLSEPAEPEENDDSEVAEPKTPAEPVKVDEAALTETFAIKQALGETGGCNLITTYLTRFSIREAMIEACARAIIKLSNNCNDNRRKFAQLETIQKLLHAQQCNEDVVETVFLTWRAIVCLLDEEIASVNHPTAPVHSNLEQFQQQSTDAIHQINKAMKGYRQFEEIHLIGAQLLIYSGYYSSAKVEELISEGFIDEHFKLKQEINIDSLKDKLGLLTNDDDEDGNDDAEEALIQKLKANINITDSNSKEN